MVWCNNDFDCFQYGSHLTNCSMHGTCFHAGFKEYFCSGLGERCHKPQDSVCNHSGECTYPCETHDDCTHGVCVCWQGLSLCSYWWCEQGGLCPPYSHPVNGTLICEPDLTWIEGDCHGYGECDASHIPVGERGCVRIE